MLDKISYKGLHPNSKKLLLKHMRNRIKNNWKKKFSINGKQKSIAAIRREIVYDLYVSRFGICPMLYFFNEKMRLEEFSNEETYVYIIGNIEKEFCKIGFSKNPSERIKSIQTGCPYEVKLLCYYKGDMITEKRLHEKYKDLRLHGEWFKLEGDLLNVVNKDNILPVECLLTSKENSPIRI